MPRFRSLWCRLNPSKPVSRWISQMKAPAAPATMSVNQWTGKVEGAIQIQSDPKGGSQVERGAVGLTASRDRRTSE